MQAPFRHTLLYDSECPLCQASVRRLRALDTNRMLEFLPNQDESVAERFPQVSTEALQGSLHLAGPRGEIREGADAMEAIAGFLPGFSWVRWLFRIPMARPLARRVYRFVARHRYRLKCRDHCSGE